MKKIISAILTFLATVASAGSIDLNCSGKVFDVNEVYHEIIFSGHTTEAYLDLNQEMKLGNRTLLFQASANDHSGFLRVLEKDAKFYTYSSSNLSGFANKLYLTATVINDPLLVSVVASCVVKGVK